MRSETFTAVIILSAVVLIFVVVSWILVRVDARSRRRDVGFVCGDGAGRGNNGVVGALSVGCGDGAAGCGAVGGGGS